MGDAADDMWDRMMERETDMALMMKHILEQCADPMESCRLVSNEYVESDDWLPYRCISCGQTFDFP